MQPVLAEQRAPPAHRVSSGVKVQVPAGSVHRSRVQAMPSSHATAMPGRHMPPTQRSVPLQTTPSEHSAAVRQPTGPASGSGGGPESRPASGIIIGPESTAIGPASVIMIGPPSTSPPPESTSPPPESSPPPPESTSPDRK